MNYHFRAKKISCLEDGLPIRCDSLKNKTTKLHLQNYRYIGCTYSHNGISWQRMQPLFVACSEKLYFLREVIPHTNSIWMPHLVHNGGGGFWAKYTFQVLFFTFNVKIMSKNRNRTVSQWWNPNIIPIFRGGGVGTFRSLRLSPSKCYHLLCWRRHLKTAKLSKSDKWRLYLEDKAVKCPIHLFSECPALEGFRHVLFNYTYPSQLTGQQSLYQVTELALHGSIQELIERTDQNGPTFTRRNRHCPRQWFSRVMALGPPLGLIVLGNSIV